MVWTVLFVFACLISTACGGGMAAPMPQQRQLLSMSIDPGDAEATAPDGTAPFTVTGTFDQDPTTQAGIEVTWKSSDTTVAPINSQTGVAICIGVGGPITLTASASGHGGTVQATATLTCMAAPPGAIGQCIAHCGSTRCGAMTGYCAVESDNACRLVYDWKDCTPGRPGPIAEGCGSSAGTGRPCTPVSGP
jgi:hypothetical protein